MTQKDNAPRTSPVSPLISLVSSVNNGNKKQSEPNSSSSNVDSKVLNNSGSGSAPSVSESAKGKTVEPKKMNETESGPQSTNHENCDGVPDIKKCRDLKKLVACIQSDLIDSRNLAVLVENEGEVALKVNFSGGNFFGELQLLEHHTKRINIPWTAEKSSKLILNAGNGECVLHTSPSPFVSGDNFFLRLPSYEQLVTPVNAAYFLLVSVLILAGSWVCCKFRRRRPGNVPYQELEMAEPESSSAINVETAEGWDEVGTMTGMKKMPSSHQGDATWEASQPMALLPDLTKMAGRMIGMFS